MSQSSVLYTVDGSVATITLNRPKVLNALNTDLNDRLRTALVRAKADAAVRAVVLTGAGRGFCAGADLNQPHMAAGEFDAAQSLREDHHTIVLTMRHFPKPLIAAVNGPAAGAGMSFALACDIVLAAESATFLQAFAKLGLVPDCGSTWLLPRLIGEMNARALMLLAEPISGAQAKGLGMVWNVLPDAELMNEVYRMAHYLASMPTKALFLIKQALSASAMNGLADQLELEGLLQNEAFRTEDVKEGVAAFTQKRAPRFIGR